ncbi:aminoglycoside phosphotransferase family protein [Phytomonospora sp. NPDC050363]|uniref:aminoglycoside phosphotransferase family protein n=1 Tax=Phytomonospora sp. NPDC050363 TaxID=3155642 RepID=UPI0033E94C51
MRRLLAAQFPQSVRMPRYERWAGQVEREHHWLPRPAPFLPLAVSTPLAKGDPGEGYPYPWSIYRWLDGGNAVLEALADPAQAARDLAEFITALQAVDTTGGPGPQWSSAFRGVALGDPADSIAVEARVRPKIAALAGMVDTALLTEVWEASLAAPAWHGQPVWVHGDLGIGNLLAAWTFFDDATREIFRAELGVDDDTWTRARGRGLASSLPVPGDPFFAGRPDRVERALRRLDEITADYLARG